MTPRPLALLAGLVLAAPALWRALVTGTMAPDTALNRTLVALVVASVAAVGIETLLTAYTGERTPAQGEDAPSQPARRATDPPASTDDTTVLSTPGLPS